MYEHNPALYHQKADPLTVGSSCSNRRCVSPRTRTKHRCSASHTPDTPNPSLLFSAGKVLPSLSADQIKSLLSNCVNTRGQLADAVSVSAEETSESAEESPMFSLLLSAYTQALLVCFAGVRPAPSVRCQPIEICIFTYPRPQQRHVTSLRLTPENTKTSIKKTRRLIYSGFKIKHY